jgi:2-polyprenyl-6-methoxyphenol hydroxylase-like FAD-dependent oxidoreductase
MNAIYDVVILGASYAGLVGALRLRRMKETFRIALINASDQFAAGEHRDHGHAAVPASSATTCRSPSIPSTI